MTTQTAKGLTDLDFQVEVRLPKQAKEGSKLLAFCQVVINGAYVVQNIAIREGQNGPFPSMPSQKGKDKDGKEAWKDVFFPITKDARKALYDAILAAYEAKLAESEDA